MKRQTAAKALRTGSCLATNQSGKSRKEDPLKGKSPRPQKCALKGSQILRTVIAFSLREIGKVGTTEKVGTRLSRKSCAPLIARIAAPRLQPFPHDAADQRSPDITIYQIKPTLQNRGVVSIMATTSEGGI